MGLLEVPTANLRTGNLGRDGEDGRTAAMGIEQSVDQVEIPGPTASGTDGETAGELGLRPGGKGGTLFMPGRGPTRSPFAGGSSP